VFNNVLLLNVSLPERVAGAKVVVFTVTPLILVKLPATGVVPPMIVLFIDPPVITHRLYILWERRF
jgi:hypothetical protein